MTSIEVDLTVSPKVVKTETETYLAKAVIIATGSKYKELGVPGEKELSGHGVSWCATCDGFFFREQDIAVIGGGDSAARGGAVPHPVRQDRDARAPARQAARVEDHAGAGVRQPQDQVPVGQRADRDGRRRQGLRAAGPEHPQRRRDRAAGRRRVHRDRPPAAQRAVRRPARPSPPRATWRSRAGPPGPRSRASSPAATWSTTCTGRPSPRPAAAAPPRSTRSAGWPSTSTPTPTRTHNAHRQIEHGRCDHHGYDQGRHRRDLRGGGPEEQQAGHRRLLGRVVWPVPDDRPGPRGDRRRVRARRSTSSS